MEGRFRGGMRPYGFEDDGVTIRDHEADLIREAPAVINCKPTDQAGLERTEASSAQCHA